MAEFIESDVLKRSWLEKFQMNSVHMGVRQFLVSLVLFSLLVQQCPLVKADQALINSVCSKTGNNNQYCLDCFKTPISVQQDIKGLAGTSVLCASSTSFSTRQATSDLAKRSIGKFQQDLFRCVRILDDTLEEYSAAFQWLGIGRYSDATNQLNLAMNQVLDCINLLGLHVLPSDLLFDLVKDFAMLKGEIEVAINVVSQIPS